MADSGTTFKDLATSLNKPRTKERPNGVVEPVQGVSNVTGDQINPATLESVAALSTALVQKLNELSKDTNTAAGNVKLDEVKALLGSLVTNTQLRASALPVSLASVPFNTSAASDAKLEQIRLALAGLLTESQIRATPLAVNVNTSGLPSGAMTEATGLAIKNAVLSTQNFEETIFTSADGSVVYFRRVTFDSNTGTSATTWVNISGTTIPAPANAVPVSSASLVSPDIAYFDVIANGSGYVIGNVVARVALVNSATGAIQTTVYYNVNTNVVIPNPVLGDLILQEQNVKAVITQLPATSPTLANQSAGNASLASIDGKVATAANQATANTTLSSILTAETSGNTTLTSILTAENTGNTSLTSIDNKVATAANQSTANTTLSNILAADISSNTALGNILTAENTANTALSNILTAENSGNTTLANILTALGSTLTVKNLAEEDPIFNHTFGLKQALTTASSVLITPPVGSKYLRITTDADILINTANLPVVDDGTSVLILANSVEVIPVVANVAVRARALINTATVRATPLKVR